jgi:predicted RNase H-like HicB family nuclease
MPRRRFKVLLEWDAAAEVWVTDVPALGHLSTCGATRGEALANTQEAILGWIAAAEHVDLGVADGAPDVELVDLDVTLA